MLKDVHLKKAVLTPAFVASVSVTKRTDFPDHKIPGLVLRVTPAGAKTWGIRYRFRGQSKRFTLGTVELLSLDKARVQAKRKLGDAANGHDPAAEKRQRLPKGHTFEALVREYIAHGKRTKRSWKEEEQILRYHVMPTWKHVTVTEITRRDVRDLVQPIADRGTPVIANRVLAILCTVFNFGIAHDWMTANPAFKLERPGGDIPSRETVLTDDQLALFWKVCDQEPLIVSTFLRVRLLTAQRGGELAKVQWSDVDLDHRTFTIPATVAKNGRAHQVPLSRTAAELLAALPCLDHRLFPLGFAYLMASMGRVVACMTAALRQTDPSLTLDLRGHDLRRTAATLMAKAGIPVSDISRVLNHMEGGPKATQVYQRHEFDREKRIALEALEREVLRIVNGQPKSGTVVPMTG